MNISIIKQNNTFDNIELIEEVSKVKAKSILDNWDILNLYNDKKDNLGKKKIFERYYKKIKNNKIIVKYLRKLKFGRTYAEKSLSLQNIKKDIRHYLAYDNYVDIDMENAHPVILLQILKSNSIICENLQNYVDNREEILKSIMKSDDINRDDSKKLLIMLMYGSKYVGKNNFLKSFKLEIDNIANIIFNCNQELHNEIIKNKKSDKSALKKYENNKKNSLLSYFLQEYENQILEKMYEYITLNISNENKSSITLCYDGLMIKKEEQINLKDVEEYILKETGFIINLEYKPLEDIYTEKINNIIDKIDDIPEKYMNKFNHKFCNSLSNYNSKKYYFELFISRIFTPQCLYIFKDTEESKNILYKEADLRQSFRQIKSGLLTDAGKEIKFVDYWLDDEDSFIYRKCDFLPFNEDIKDEKIPDDIFNLFFGFDKRINTKYTKSKRDLIVKPFLDLGLQLCEGKQENLDYLLKFLSNMIKEPMNRPSIAIIMKSKQGEGKGTFLKAIKNVIGKEHFISSSKPGDFFGNHSELFVNKLLVNPDECEGKDTFDFQGKMKAFISEDRISVNPKNIRPYEVNNFSRLIITTNKANPINIDFSSKDRRYVAFEATGKYIKNRKKKNNIYNSSYWTNLHNYFDSPVFISALYDYLMNIDYSNMNWIRDRPLTNLYYEMARNSLPQEVLFLEHYVSKIQLTDIDEKIYDISFSKFYNEFKDWADDNGFKNYYTSKQFSMKITEMKCGIQRNKNRKGIKLEINYEKLCNFITYVIDNDYNIEEDEEEEEIEILPDNYFCLYD